MRELNLLAQIKPQKPPADLADLRRRNPKTTEQPLPQTNCLSLRDNAACCIPLRDLRDLRENTRKSTQSIFTEENPISAADLTD